MREILFRGKGDKKYNDGVWYYGVPIQCDDGDWQICTNCSKRTVIAETIGQYTGLTDKNGKKIFEDDIVKIKGKTKYIFYGKSGFRHTNYGEYADTLENVFTVVDCEVIGNKIDNPELLRGDTE